MDDDTGNDPDFVLLAELVVDIAREIRVRSDLTTPIVSLTPTQSQVMRYVHTYPGCSASDIADGSGLRRANVSTALRELRGRGYLTSQRDETDGRSIRIYATARADENLARLREAWSALIAQAWRQGATGGSAELVDVLSGLAQVRAGLTADRAMKAFEHGGRGESAVGEESTVSPGAARGASSAARSVDTTSS
ncbi:MarR family winged helix-turn-helix transcriptional regulator [Microbacterium sp. LRZ72]|uniref:MarR family winged helix-turn-helix transcriptional regulator n=1 Tax=Microbacterium sp. LRZ72 TaxID=2942481 RepID=UPI0029BD5CD3|nr:MarR family winged helix-turn-helix transcriptional regulator [Microbacterium sp. LRZ72]MDX2377519.1 MarR family winged helix-turn-helix transcriptional regulator [Microbacterium sp. LRZ72]